MTENSRPPRTWKGYLKRGACWGAPLLLVLALPLLWSGNDVAAAGGSLLSVLAVLACPLGMYFMMRAMAQSHHAPDHPSEPAKADPSKKDGPSPIGGALLAVVLVAAAAAAPATAREPAPVAVAFEHVHALAFDAAGGTLWLGAHTGLYRSEDAGRSWTKAAPPVGHEPDVMAIAIHPTEADLVYVGTHEAGVLKTTDGGKTWQGVNSGLGGLDVHGLAIEPNAPDKLHAAVREKGSGIYRTMTGARGGWVRVDDGPSGETKALVSVNVATGMGGIFLYAGTGEGLQRSPDCF